MPLDVKEASRTLKFGDEIYWVIKLKLPQSISIPNGASTLDRSLKSLSKPGMSRTFSVGRQQQGGA